MRFISIVLALSLFVCAAPVSAQPKQGSENFSLSGGGSSDKSFNGSDISADARLGFMLTNDIELSLSQSLTYAHAEQSDTFTGSTAIGANYYFHFGQLDIGPGVYIGAEYGGETAAYCGGELRAILWLKPDLGVFGSAAYQFSSEDFQSLRGHAQDGEFLYKIGIEYSF